MEFDQRELRLALAAANLEPTEQRTATLAGRLRAIMQRHRARRAGRHGVPHKRDLLDAIGQIRNSADTILRTLDDAGDPLQLTLSAFDSGIVRQIKAVRLLRNTTEQARYYLEFEDACRGRQEIETELYLDLFDLYRDLTGKSGKGDERGVGPLYRFVKTCVTLLDPDLEFVEPSAFRGRLMAADKRRRERFTCKDLLKIAPLNLHL